MSVCVVAVTELDIFSRLTTLTLSTASTARLGRQLRPSRASRLSYLPVINLVQISRYGGGAYYSQRVRKGITKEGLNSINIEVLESLLYKDSKLEVLQDKWYKDLTSGTITIKDQLYTLKVTGNKRELIYQENKLVGTKPVRFD